MFLQSRVVVHAMARVTEHVKMVCDYIQCIYNNKRCEHNFVSLH